ncbi:MAG: HAD family hydrolase [Solirubrobacteraceae bacterium]
MIGSTQLVIFDCDGVLVDSEEISGEVLARALSTAGLPTSTADARRTYQGMMLSEVVASAEHRLGGPLPTGFLERYERDRAVEFRRRLAPVAGAGATVARIKDAGVMVCVASQGQRHKTELTLGITGLRGLFHSGNLFSAYSVSRGKPHPDLFLKAAEVMNVPPAHCVVVEDTPSGVRAAVSAGMRVFGYVADGDGAALARVGAEIIRSLEDLPGRLGLA